MDINDLEKEYEKKKPLLEALCGYVTNEIRSKLRESPVEKYQISYRVKETDSFIRKYQKPEKNYLSPFEDIQDVAGIRVTLPYSDDLPIVESCIRSRFSVDEKNSMDKATLLDPDRFGYLSVHLVVTLNKNIDPELPLKRYDGLVVEIQIRTQLQDVWANISHTLDYKSRSDVPRFLLRRLNRLAGLFEIADQELVEIKSSAGEHIQEMSKADWKDFLNSEVNADSLREYFGRLVNENSSVWFEYFNHEIDSQGGITLQDIAGECERLGIVNLQALNSSIEPSSMATNRLIKAVAAEISSANKLRLTVITLLVATYPERYRGKFLENRFGWSEEFLEGIHKTITSVHQNDAD